MPLNYNKWEARTIFNVGTRGGEPKKKKYRTALRPYLTYKSWLQRQIPMPWNYTNKERLDALRYQTVAETACSSHRRILAFAEALLLHLIFFGLFTFEVCPVVPLPRRPGSSGASYESCASGLLQTPLPLSHFKCFWGCVLQLVERLPTKLMSPLFDLILC